MGKLGLHAKRPYPKANRDRRGLGGIEAVKIQGLIRRTVVLLSLACIVVFISRWPVTTQSGVNYKWSSKQIFLYEKVFDFLNRDIQTRRIAAEVTDGALRDQDKLRMIFSWTGRNVRPTPEGFPVMDDHIQNIIVRGYGEPDQITEVFALLASYVGFPATAALLELPNAPQKIVLALVQYKAQILVFDVARQIVFQHGNGEFATLEDLLRDPQLIAAASEGITVYGVRYERYFANLVDLRFTFSRMELQKPWSRLKSEVVSFLRFAP